MFRASRALAGVLVVVAMFAISACGSDNGNSNASSNSSGASTSANTPAKVPAGPAFKVGFVCSCTGASAAQLSQQEDAIKAWASSVNAKGGIDGHGVKITFIDDGNNAARAAQAGKRLVAAKVQAVVDGSLQDAEFAKTLAAAGIPVTGGLPIQAAMFTNPDFFPSGAVLPPVILGQTNEAKAAGKKNFGVLYCKEAPVCAQLVGLVKAAASVTGGMTVKGQAVSFTQPSYTAPCLALKQAGVDSTWTAVIAPVVVRIRDACAQQNYKPLEVNETVTVQKDWTSKPSLDGSINVGSQAGWFDTSVPGIKEFQDALNQYKSGSTDEDRFGADTLSAWSGGKLFEAAVKAGKLAPSSTPADVKAGLYKLKNETLDGIAPPLTYTKGKPAFPSCYFLVGIQGGKFTTPKGSNPICPPQAQLQKLGAILAKAAG